MVLEVAFRLIAAVILIIAPTLLFLGLWHGLQYMRDEQLIEQIYGETPGSARPPQFDFSVLFSSGDPATGEDANHACVYCGKPANRKMCRRCRDQYL